MCQGDGVPARSGEDDDAKSQLPRKTIQPGQCLFPTRVHDQLEEQDLVWRFPLQRGSGSERGEKIPLCRIQRDRAVGEAKGGDKVLGQRRI